MVRTIGTMHEYVKRQTDEDDEEDSDQDPVHLQLIEAVVGARRNGPATTKRFTHPIHVRPTGPD